MRGFKWFFIATFGMISVPAVAQQIVQWSRVGEIKALGMLKPGHAVAVMSIPLGSEAWDVAAKIKERHPEVQLRSNSFTLNIADGLISAPYLAQIVTNIEGSESEEDLSFGFSSPASGSRLIAVSRTTNLKNFSGFLTADQAAEHFVKELGEPSAVWSNLPSSLQIEWVVKTGESKPTRLPKTKNDSSECFWLADELSQGNTRSMYFALATSMWEHAIGHDQAQCRDNYDLYISMYLWPSGESSRFKRIRVMIIDIAAAKQAHEADKSFITAARKSAEPTGGAYKP